MDSMTGFGRGEAEQNNIKITAELKSVNHRFLDLSIRMPRQLSPLEDCARSLIKQNFTRGRVEISIYADFSGVPQNSVSVNTELVKNYLEASKLISKETGVKNKLLMSDLLRLPDVMCIEKKDISSDDLKPILEEALTLACQGLKSSRKAEGERLITDILDRIDILSGIVDRIVEREPIVIDEYKTKLKARLEEFLSETDIDPIRFNQEILYFADKANVTEETVRLKSHFERMKDTLGGETANGRALDFIVQEMNREFNTIGSKSSDLEITNLVITAKGEVEKIREQVQNIE
ncbi:MAG: YicC family protein [Christensenellaceae bacterium]|nr:YicC family protein [Christensenellaceae bacterium]